MTTTGTTDTTRPEPVPWATLIDALAESNARALATQRAIRDLETTVIIALILMGTTIYLKARSA